MKSISSHPDNIQYISDNVNSISLILISNKQQEA